MKAKLRSINTFKDYEELIVAYGSLLHEVVDEFYRIFQISDRITMQHHRVVPPEKIGCDASWKIVPKFPITQSFYDNSILRLVS